MPNHLVSFTLHGSARWVPLPWGVGLCLQGCSKLNQADFQNGHLATCMHLRVVRLAGPLAVRRPPLLTTAMTTAFVNLADLAKAVVAPDGTVSTAHFLELCRQVLPVIGALIVVFAAQMHSDWLC